MNYDSEVSKLVAELFGCEAGAVQMNMKPGDLPRWDSLGHILLLEKLQESFAVEIPLEAAFEASNLGELTALIESALRSVPSDPA